MIGAHKGALEHARSEDADKADRAGSRDVNHVWAYLVGPTEHVEQWGKGHFEVAVAGHAHAEEWSKIVDIRSVRAAHGRAGSDVKAFPRGEGMFAHGADESADAVDIAECVGEKREARGALGDAYAGTGTSVLVVELVQERALLILLKEAEEVRSLGSGEAGVGENMVEHAATVFRTNGLERSVLQKFGDGVSEVDEELLHRVVLGQGRTVNPGIGVEPFAEGGVAVEDGIKRTAEVGPEGQAGARTDGASECVPRERERTGWRLADTCEPEQTCASEATSGRAGLAAGAGIPRRTDTRELVGEQGRVAADPPDGGAAFHHLAEEVAWIGGGVLGVESGPGSSDVEKGVVVASGGTGFLPGAFPQRFEGVLFGDIEEPAGSQCRKEAFEGGLLQARMRAVEGFKAFEKQSAAFEMPGIEACILDVEGVCQCVGKLLFAKPVGERVDIVSEAEFGDLLVLVGGKAPHEHVEFATVFREVHGHFFAENEVLESAVQKFKAALDGVVVGEGDKIHASSERLVVYLFRGGIAFRTTNEPEGGECRAVRSAGVAMGVDAEKARRLGGGSRDHGWLLDRGEWSGTAVDVIPEHRPFEDDSCGINRDRTRSERGLCASAWPRDQE